MSLNIMVRFVEGRRISQVWCASMRDGLNLWKLLTHAPEMRSVQLFKVGDIDRILLRNWPAVPNRKAMKRALASLKAGLKP